MQESVTRQNHEDNFTGNAGEVLEKTMQNDTDQNDANKSDTALPLQIGSDSQESGAAD